MKRKFKSKGKYSSNASIFARRGDPWVSRKEGERDFQRNLETENPDFDRFVRAKPVKERKPFIDPKPEPIERDYAREKTSIFMGMKARLEPRRQVIEAKMPVNVFRPCPGCRKAICIAKGACFRV